MKNDSTTSQTLAGLELTFEDLTLQAASPSNSSPRSDIGHTSNDLYRLWRIDKECDNLMKSTLVMMDSLASDAALPEATVAATLDSEVQWITKVSAGLQSLENHDDEAICVFSRAMARRLSDLKASLYAFHKVLAARTPLTFDSPAFNTGT